MTTPGRAHDAHRDRLPDAEGVTRCQRVVPNLDFRGIGDGDAGQIGSVDLQYGDIAFRIGADHFGFELALIGECDCDSASAIHYVVIGKDIALPGHNDARTEAPFPPPSGLTRRPETPVKVIAEKLAEHGIIRQLTEESRRNFGYFR